MSLAKENSLINLYQTVYARQKLVKALKIVGAISVSLVVLSFAYALFRLLILGEYISAIRLVAFTLIPFLVVSLMRCFIDCKRPYEVFDIPELLPLKEEGKAGRSFPSRHVFSAFLIGTTWFLYSPWIAATVLCLGVMIALERVLLGIHFIKDVITGATTGILSGIIVMLIW